MGVLFASYLRGDPTARDWAEEVLGEAVLDAEQAALAAHHDALWESGVGTSWRLTSSHASPDRAELDGSPYGDLIVRRARTVGGARQVDIA